MKGFLRRLRGVIKTGLIGAAGFGAALSGFFALTGHVDAILIALPYTAFAGFLVGGVSAGIFSLTERHRRLEDLSLRRVALWGAMGGSLVTVAFNLVTVGFVARAVAWLRGGPKSRYRFLETARRSWRCARRPRGPGRQR